MGTSDPHQLDPIWMTISLTKNSNFKKNIDKSRGVHIWKCQNLIVSGLNGVAVAPHGPILDHNEATGSRKLFRYLPDLRDPIKYLKKSENPKMSKFPYISVIFLLTPI